jgi:hypothetical protein
MRVPTSLSELFAPPAARRTTACSRCGDSFLGSAAAGRTWLHAHDADEHTHRAVAPVSPTAGRAAPRRAPVLRESLSASRG